MSILLLDELTPGVVFVQDIYVTKDVDIAGIRPWVYIQGVLATGDFICRIKDEGGTTLKSTLINYVDINAIGTDTFKHGKILFEFNGATLHLAPGDTSTLYTLEFEMINYVNDPNNFVGIVRDWEDPVWISIDDLPNSNVAPCGIEIFEYKEKR